MPLRCDPAARGPSHRQHAGSLARAPAGDYIVRGGRVNRVPQGVRRYVLEQCCYLIEAVCVGAEVVTIRPSACEIELSRIMVGTGRPWWTHVQAVRRWDPNTAPTVSKKLHKSIGAYGRKTNVFLAYYEQ
jgi:hypothetical protein